MFKFIFLFLLSFNACAFDEWSEADKTREAAFIAVTSVDWLQTRNIARHNCTNPATGLHDCYEAGPAAMFIGNNPSVGKVNTYFASILVAHVSVTNALPAKYRAAFQITSIICEASYVAGNYKIGISAKF